MFDRQLNAKPERNSMDVHSQGKQKQRGQSINYERPWRNNKKNSNLDLKDLNSLEHMTPRVEPKSTIMIKRKLNRNETESPHLY